MKRIHIDFAPRSFRRAARRTRPVVRLLACAGLLACVGAVVMAFDLRQRHEDLRMESRRVEAQLARRAAVKPEPKKFTLPEAQANAVNAAIAQLNLPWRDVFDTVEAATPGSIALLALDPDARKHVLKGTAESKTSEGMIAYVEQLKQQAFFDAVVLTKHEINEQDPNKPIRFQFEARWTGEAR